MKKGNANTSKVMFPCAGIIVFRGNETIVVETERGNLSFPKGKRNKTESCLEAAWRELFEETGLRPENVSLIPGMYFDEYTDKARPAVRYFVGNLQGSCPRFSYDHEELVNVYWIHIETALMSNRLKEARKHILADAHRFLKT